MDLSLPLEALDAAGLSAGEKVTIHVTPSGRIVIAAMRRWPRVCPNEQCERADEHAGACVPAGDVPY